MMNLPAPILYAYRCTGCGACVEQCPVGALAQQGGKAVVAAPDACTYCLRCEDVCPSDAIALPFIVVFDKERHQAA